jgi:hypothetical protein
MLCCWLSDFGQLTWRASAEIYCNYGALLIRCCTVLFFAVLLSLIYQDLDDSQQSIQDRVGLLYFILINQVTTRMHSNALEYNRMHSNLPACIPANNPPPLSPLPCLLSPLSIAIFRPLPLCTPTPLPRYMYECTCNVQCAVVQPSGGAADPLSRREGDREQRGARRLLPALRLLPQQDHRRAARTDCHHR